MAVTQRCFSACLLLLVCAACADLAPTIEDRNTVYTPVFGDNRVYYLKARDLARHTQALEPLGLAVPSSDGNIIPRNSPLSVVLRSIEIPAATSVDASGNQVSSPITEAADYVVLLDIGTNSDGSTQSIVVWYQRGIQPDQSLNFSNLLVYYEPRWDERVAPFFRIRVMDITNERNAETRRSLERARSIGGAVGALGANPLVSPLIGIAITAAELVVANRQNRLILDYSVQLYSSGAAGQAGSGELGVLRRGSYIVVGRPNADGREYWTNTFEFSPESRVLRANDRRTNVPVALLTIGTFESIVPTSVLERSTALTALLASNGRNATIEQIDEASRRLAAGVQAFTMGERLSLNQSDVDTALGALAKQDFKASVGADNIFFLVRAMNECFRPQPPFTSLQDVETYRTKNPNAPCVSK